MNVLEYIKSDLCRYVGRNNITMRNFLRHYFFNSGFKFSFWLRISSLSKYKIIRIIGVIQHFRLSRKYDLFIPIRTKIGFGFGISHGRSVYINATAKIGNNVTVSQFTTIGSDYKNAAHIGNNVYIGPNVCIVENVKIGNNVKVGAGSIVVKDIPSNYVSAGVPNRLIKKNPENEDLGRWIS